MSMTDPIADMLTRIRNALQAEHRSTDIPASRMKTGIAEILQSEGFINGWETIADRRQGILRIELRYGPNGEMVITGLERVSRPGRRVYRQAEKIPEVLGGFGINIVSTSQGLLSGHDAKQRGIGGEVLLNVW
ncbi:MAG: 30S ribosomal protein S8 [Acidobacteriota bacterium]